MSRHASSRLPRRAAARHATTMLAAVVLLTACSGDAPTGPGSDDVPKPPAGSEPAASNPLLTMAGCNGNRAGASWGEISSYSPLAGFGDAQADASFWAEVAAQRSFWGNSVPADVYIIRDGPGIAANAFAFSSGWIGFGYYFYHQHVAQHGQLAIDGTLAHEWGHRAQLVHGWPTTNPTFELEADAFSGYYVALAKQRSWGVIQGYYQHFASIGDRNFNSPEHHGTPRQRMAAGYLGVQAGVQAIQRGQAFTYEQLHQFFSQQIAQQIIPNRSLSVPGSPSLSVGRAPIDSASNYGPRAVPLGDIVGGRSNGAEVTYTRRTAEELRELRPRDTVGARLESAH